LSEKQELNIYTFQGELIGQGAQKQVYKAFDEELGVEVQFLNLDLLDMPADIAQNSFAPASLSTPRLLGMRSQSRN
jgi:spermidine/putrescine-binding protein